MLIRSQNQKKIININKIDSIEINESEIYAKNHGWFYYIGEYSNEEKAIKVLDMIEKFYTKPVICDVFSDNEKFIYSKLVFHMPQDNEV